MKVNAVLFYKYIYFIYIYYFLNHGQQEQLNLIFDTLSEVSSKLRELSIKNITNRKIDNKQILFFW